MEKVLTLKTADCQSFVIYYDRTILTLGMASSERSIEFIEEKNYPHSFCHFWSCICINILLYSESILGMYIQTPYFVLRFTYNIIGIMLYTWNPHLVWFMVFNVTFNNISVMSWPSVLLVEEIRVLGENHWPVPSHWQTLSHHVLSTPTLPCTGFKLTTLLVIGTDCTGSCSWIYNYHTITTITALPYLVLCIWWIHTWYRALYFYIQYLHLVFCCVERIHALHYSLYLSIWL